MREAVPAFAMAKHAVSTAVSHRSGVSSSTPAPVSAQVVVAAAMANSAERLLAAAEEAARSAARVGVSREWSASWLAAAVVAGSMWAGGSTVWVWDSRRMARLMRDAAVSGAGGGCSSVVSSLYSRWMAELTMGAAVAGGGGEGVGVWRSGGGGGWVAAA